MTTAKKPRQKAVIRSFWMDDEGLNKVFIKSTDKTITVSLNLKGEGSRKRKIGVITKSTRTLKISRKRYDHLFIKGNAYGFNDYIMRNAKQFDTVALSDEFADWKIPREFILEHGRYYHFLPQGFELQRFLSLEELEPFKVKPKENRRM